VSARQGGGLTELGSTPLCPQLTGDEHSHTELPNADGAVAPWQVQLRQAQWWWSGGWRLLRRPSSEQYPRGAAGECRQAGAGSIQPVLRSHLRAQLADC
jgi:hypothetical protein